MLLSIQPDPLVPEKLARGLDTSVHRLGLASKPLAKSKQQQLAYCSMHSPSAEGGRHRYLHLLKIKQSSDSNTEHRNHRRSRVLTGVRRPMVAAVHSGFQSPSVKCRNMPPHTTVQP